MCRDFSHEKYGVEFWVGKKREGNFTLSPDISRFRTMSVPSHWLQICSTLGTCVKCISVFGYFFSSSVGDVATL